MSRLISIDFDGVLHPTSAIDGLSGRLSSTELEHQAAERGLFGWRPHLEALLADHGDVMLSVHSSWRCLVDDSAMRRLLGPILSQHFVGITSRDLGRQDGISDLAQRAGVEIDQLLAIDDDRSSFGADFAPLLLVDPDTGISSGSVQARITAWLVQTAPTPVRAAA